MEIPLIMERLMILKNTLDELKDSTLFNDFPLYREDSENVPLKSKL